MISSVRAAAQAARDASRKLAQLPETVRNAALFAIAEALRVHASEIIRVNETDVVAAAELPFAMRKRLVFDTKKLVEASKGVEAVAALEDPIGQTILARELAPDLNLYRVTCPIGVVGVVFESRPDALIQIAALCLKSGNAAILKGGREAMETNRLLFSVMNAAALDAGLPEAWAMLLETREDVAEMLTQDDCIDLLIPRGSNAFVRYIKENSRIPVLGHAAGLCHVYVDTAADLQMSLSIIRDSKLQYVAVCNAMETLLVHADCAPVLLPRLPEALPGTTIRGCNHTRVWLACDPATEDDWDTEYLDTILSVRVVDSVEDAIDHINQHGSGHTDAIVTEDAEAAARFLQAVDSANVYWNCSTRFSDGYRYGLGAELGVATGKVHARGPMGVEGLTIHKYKLLGRGHTVQATLDESFQYTHRLLQEDCPI